MCLLIPKNELLGQVFQTYKTDATERITTPHSRELNYVHRVSKCQAKRGL